jgi:hypothetical protein
VTVSDGRYEIRCTYSGAQSGTGPACTEFVEADVETIVRGAKVADTRSSFEYRVKVINHGPYEAVDVSLNNFLDAVRDGEDVKGLLRDASGSASQGDCHSRDNSSGTGKRVLCDLGTIPEGGMVTVTIRIKTGPHKGPISMTAKAHSPTYDPNRKNNDDDIETAVK